MKNKRFAILSALSIFIYSWAALAAEKETYQIQKLSDNSYVFTYVWGQNSKTNIGVVASDEGFLLINTMMLDQVKLLEQELAKIANKPVKYIINSNSDWYNTSANKYFADKGASIIAHQGSVYQLNNYSQLLFADSLELEFGGEKIMAYKSQAHSVGHVNIHLKNANAIFVADSYSPRWVAPMGPNGIEGQIASLNSLVRLSDDNTKIIPGNVASATMASLADVKREITTRSQLFQRVSQLQENDIPQQQIIKDKQVNQLLKGYEQYTRLHNKPWLYDRINFHRIKGKQSLSEQQLQAYVGDYHLPDGRVITVFSKKGHLYAKAKGIFYFSLVPAGKDKFWFNPENFQQSLLFTRDANQNVTGIKAKFEPDSSHHLKRLASLEITKSS